ncbi:hypothetical protein P7C73_g5154, partial [Tremellales sp. Uapishka_1]
MPASPAASLFASDYSVSAPPSPGASGTPGSPLPRPKSSPNLLPPGTKPLEVVFPTSTSSSNLPTPPVSPSRGSYDNLTSAPGPVMKKKPSIAFSVQSLQSDKGSVDIEMSRKSSSTKDRRKSSAGPGYKDFDSCMEGGLGHETKAATYAPGTEKAYHHLNRAKDLFGGALSFKANHPRAMLARAKVLIALAMNYQPPRTATVSLREATSLLRDLIVATPKSISARESLAQACGLLSNTLLETDDLADDETKIWEGEIGKLAREALQNLEDVAADRMDKMRDLRQEESAQQSPIMAETFLSLSAAAITVSSLAVDLASVDLHVELAEQALDQASNMATVAAAARVKSSSSSANLITRVQLASGRSSLERLRHTFVLGVDLDEDDFRSLMADMSMLATECRERAAKLKGSKAAAAASLAYEAVRQLGDAKVLYASLLRLVWRKRKPARRGSEKDASRKLSARVNSVESTIMEEDDDNESAAVSAMTSRRESGTSNASSGRASAMRKGSALDAIVDGEERTSFSASPRRGSSAVGHLGGGSFSVPPTGRRGSWLPTTGDALVGRTRRASSMSAPLTGPDGISAWNRKASVINLGAETGNGVVPSAKLAESAWQLLESAVKQYKLALSVLSTSDLPTAQLARAKADTLTGIASSSLFMASLASRVAIAKEKRTSLLVTAEVYSTWAAREVGWSFLIEGTKEAQLADRRTNSWRADESGKKAVLLLVRVWWHRAVTADSIEVDTKAGAKDAVERVVRRMKDREGCRDGDVVRFKAWIGEKEGVMDEAETLFWRSVSRILRGGNGFVMS